MGPRIDKGAEPKSAERVTVKHAASHPRRAMAKDESVPMLGEAWEIAQRQARKDEGVFPPIPLFTRRASPNFHYVRDSN